MSAFLGSAHVMLFSWINSPRKRWLKEVLVDYRRIEWSSALNISSMYRVKAEHHPHVIFRVANFSLPSLPGLSSRSPLSLSFPTPHQDLLQPTWVSTKRGYLGYTCSRFSLLVQSVRVCFNRPYLLPIRIRMPKEAMTFSKDPLFSSKKARCFPALLIWASTAEVNRDARVGCGA